MPDATLTTVASAGLVTVNAKLPVFLINTDCPVDTSVADGKTSFKLATVADTSMMLATTLEVLPLTGHCKVVSVDMVKLS